MDTKKRTWNSYPQKKSSSVLISLMTSNKKEDDVLYPADRLPVIMRTKQAKVAIIFAAFIFLSLCLYISFSKRIGGDYKLKIASSQCPQLLHRPKDTVQVNEWDGNLESTDWINKECFNGSPPHDVDSISTALHLWALSEDSTCRKLYSNFVSIYQVREKIAEITISDTFLVKVKGWLKDDEELIENTKKQTLVFVDNLYTQESVVFNPVRSRRPGASGGDSSEIMEKLLESSQDSCDFCKYKELTATDSFGILESNHSVIVSNTFKIEKYHGMILLKQHNPSQFTMEQFLDAMNLANKWYGKVRELVPDHEFRYIYWDVYPKASASQVHPHLHIMLGSADYYAKWNNFHTSALNYANYNDGSNYWNRMIEAHNSLGLAVQFGDAYALAYLTPQKDYAIFVICREPTLDFFKMVYFVYRAFIDDLKLYAYSSGFVFPKLGTDSKDSDNELPAVFSVVYRGSLSGSRSDISSFDLFGTANVNVSPYKVIGAIQSSVEKRKDEKHNLKEFGFR